jgi:glutaredoxin
LAALQPDRHVILYTRAGCHLCEEANEVLQSFGLHAELVDIDQRPELLAEYNECVPVVEIDGKVRFRGRINRLLLERLLKNKNA